MWKTHGGARRRYIIKKYDVSSFYTFFCINFMSSISLREAARLQSFPDDFYFEGSRSAAFKQIGNAVPPLMANAIAKKMKQLLCQKS